MSPAVTALRSAFDANPEKWELRHGLMDALIADGQTEAAVDLLRHIESLPPDAESLILAAKCYHLAGSSEDAGKILASVIGAQPDNASAHLAQAIIADETGDEKAALQHYGKAVGLDPATKTDELQKKYGDKIAAANKSQALPVAKALKVDETPSGKVAKYDPTSAPAPKDASPDTPAPGEAAAKPAKAKTPSEAPLAVAVAVADEDDDDASYSEAIIVHDFESFELLRERQHGLEEKHKAEMRRDKIASLTITILLHAAVIFLIGLVVVAVPQSIPPQIVATSRTEDETEDIKTETVERTEVRPTTTASTNMEIVSAASTSSIAMSNVEFEGSMSSPSIGASFEPSMSLGDTATSMDSKMMFGQKMEGDVLGVILDVSGSMAEYLPMVLREVDKNFENAPVVYVNHAEIRGDTKSIEIYPIVKEEVTPVWYQGTPQRVNSPYWFLWHDLPRKAPQKSVDRLIGIFKDRPNSFIARGGTNRIGAAAEFLISQEVDSLYIFSDWEDFVDKEYCEALGQQLGRNKVRTYVQPAAKRTDYLHIVSLQVANRTKGREMPPLTKLLRPDVDTMAPIVAFNDEPEKIKPPEGVQYATKRETRDGPGVVKNYGYWDGADHEKRFGQELKVVEYENFDIVLAGPEARAFIYMKTPEGYIQNPIIFGYHSHKPFIDEEDKTRYRRRTWLRNSTEPTFDGKEFTWDMVLEDEIEFKVRFWFKEDTVTATYIAEKPPEGQSDNSFIYFRVPPLAVERADRYYSVDFPGGLTLDDLRLAMPYNTANVYLPALAADRNEATWNRLGFKRGDNPLPFNIMYRTLPDAVREVTIGGPSFGPRKLQARTINNNLLLNTYTRADMELWEGFLARLTRPADRRERMSRAEAIAFSVE